MVMVMAMVMTRNGECFSEILVEPDRNVEPSIDLALDLLDGVGIVVDQHACWHPTCLECIVKLSSLSGWHSAIVLSDEDERRRLDLGDVIHRGDLEHPEDTLIIEFQLDALFSKGEPEAFGTEGASLHATAFDHVPFWDVGGPVHRGEVDDRIAQDRTFEGVWVLGDQVGCQESSVTSSDRTNT